MKKALLITSFLILIPLISVHVQETEQEPYTSVDFKIGFLSHATINIEKVHKINMNVAILSNFGPSYIYTFISPDGYLAEAHGPGMHFSYTWLGGQKQYGLRDSHFEISVGIYLGMLLYGFSIGSK